MEQTDSVIKINWYCKKNMYARIRQWTACDCQKILAQNTAGFHTFVKRL